MLEADNKKEAIETIKRIWKEQVALANDDPNSYNAGARDIAFKIGSELFGEDFSRGEM